ncbi:MAG TPA: FkbM family methyltransferase [Planctomycetaceae bacterium]|nr:FkbM family methyltransferase [Planctomycetaceae bacterium]
MNLLQKIARSDSPKLERPFKAFWGYLLQETGFSERLNLKRSHYTVPFFARSNMALTLWVNPNVVDRAEEFVYDFLNPGDTLIDVGANIGCVTAAGALAVGSGGRVLSIEPHPQTYKHLLKTVKINHCDNVTCCNVALGSEEGVLNFTDEQRKDDNNCVALNADSGITVSCVTLNSLVEEHGIARIAVMKIDVEGFEMHVLQGATEILNRVDSIYIEVLEHTLQKFGSNSAAVVSLLQSHGFRCFYFKDDRSNVVAFASHVSLREWQQELVAIPDSN